MKKKLADCTECTHCIPLGEGDFLCDEWDRLGDEPIIVLEDYAPTADFAKCKGRYFEK